MDDDFERRRELRRQKREEMRLEAEKNSELNDDEEEAARERRRRARQERLRNKENEDTAAMTAEGTGLNSTNSVIDAGKTTSSLISAASEDDQALLDRIAKREERRKRRMQDALERQKELDPTVTDGAEVNQDETSGNKTHYLEPESEENNKAPEQYSWREKDEKEEQSVNDTKQEDVKAPSERSAPEPNTAAVVEEEVGDGKLHGEVAEEKSKKLFFKQQEVPDDKQKRSFKKEEVGEKKMTKEAEFLQKKKDITQQSKQQNGSLRDDQFGKVKKPETIPSRPNEARTQDPASRKLEEIKKRRGESESEEFEKMRQKQQEAEAELEELKKKRDERKKVLEQEENQKKQELAEKKAKEEEEKRRMKEEIEKRRAEAAEKRQKVEDAADGDTKKPFTCVSPKGSSLKIGVRAEFLNKSAQKSTSSLKASHTPIVSKIGNRLEQYNSAIQSNRDVKSPKSPTSDLPLVTDGIRNIKSMWQKGNVSASPAGPASPGATNKEAAGMKTGVAGRINDWGTKTPESSKAAGGKPADLKPGDVTNKRNLWEAKMSDASKSKTVTNAGMGH